MLSDKDIQQVTCTIIKHACCPASITDAMGAFRKGIEMGVGYLSQVVTPDHLICNEPARLHSMN